MKFKTWTVSITLSIEAETKEEAEEKYLDHIKDGIFDADSIETELEND